MRASSAPTSPRSTLGIRPTQVVRIATERGRLVARADRAVHDVVHDHVELGALGPVVLHDRGPVDSGAGPHEEVPPEPFAVGVPVELPGFPGGAQRERPATGGGLRDDRTGHVKRGRSGQPVGVVARPEPEGSDVEAAHAN